MSYLDYPYIYLHRYASGGKQGQVMYIGVGTGDRIDDTYSRNKTWTQSVAKYGYTKEIYNHYTTREEALLKEIELIAQYKAKGEACCNLSMGGETLFRIADNEPPFFSNNYKYERLKQNKIVPIPQYEPNMDWVEAKDMQGYIDLLITVDMKCKKLSEKHQKILRMAWEGYKWREISDALGVHRSTVHRVVMLFRALMNDLK